MCAGDCHALRQRAGLRRLFLVRVEVYGSDHVGSLLLVLSRQCVKVVYLPDRRAMMRCSLFVGSPFGRRTWLTGCAQGVRLTRA